MDASGKGTSTLNQSKVIFNLCNDMAKTIREQVILVIEQLVDAKANIWTGFLPRKSAVIVLSSINVHNKLEKILEPIRTALGKSQKCLKEKFYP